MNVTKAIRSGLVALTGMGLLIGCAFPAWGQRGRGGVARAGVVSRAPMVHSAPMAARPAARPMARLTARPLSPGYSRFNHTTNRSISYAHSSSVRLVRDRYGRLHRVAPIIFIGGGYPGYYPYDSDYYPYDYGYDQFSGDDSQQPVYDAVEQPAPSPGPSERAAARPQAPDPDAGHLILMRNDGQVVFANAFTISGDRLTYITQEGARRSFPVADLDKDTTRKMNDANGTSVVIPN